METKCCGLRYMGENHNPVRDDGHCMHCGHGSSAYKKLEAKIKELELRIEQMVGAWE